MIVFQHSQKAHTLEVEERETTRIAILTRAGWRVVLDDIAASQQAIDAPKPGKPKGKPAK